jgi:phosphoribosyl-ATP pyrophosphohydrolase
LQDILEKLYGALQQRKQEAPDKSYTAGLFAKGLDAIAAKLREETDELIEAAALTDRAHTVHEAADVLFHELVLLAYCGIEPREVFAELERRFGISGIEEKQSRKTAGNNDAQ